MFTILNLQKYVGGTQFCPMPKRHAFVSVWALAVTVTCQENKNIITLRARGVSWAASHGVPERCLWNKTRLPSDNETWYFAIFDDRRVSPFFVGLVELRPWQHFWIVQGKVQPTASEFCWWSPVLFSLSWPKTWFLLGNSWVLSLESAFKASKSPFRLVRPRFIVCISPLYPHYAHVKAYNTSR